MLSSMKYEYDEDETSLTRTRILPMRPYVLPFLSHSRSLKSQCLFPYTESH